MFDIDMTRLMQRYVGKQVTVQTHGYTRVIGTMAGVHDSCIRLMSAVRLHELEDSRWYGEIERENQEAGVAASGQETLISIHSITSITCEEDAFFLDDIENDDDPSDGDTSEPLVVVKPPIEEPAAESLLELRIGPALVRLVAEKRNQNRIEQLRHENAELTGVLIPPIRIRDDFRLDSAEYQIVVRGRTVAGWSLAPEMLIAIRPDGAKRDAKLGEEVSEPVFGVPAVWIDEDQRRRAELLGYTVVDPWAVVVTHLGEVSKRMAHELFRYEETQGVLESLRKSSQSLVENHFATSSSQMRLHRVFHHLVKWRIPICYPESIAVAVANHPREREESSLLRRVRLDILDDILHAIRDRKKQIRTVALASSLEQAISQPENAGDFDESSFLERLVELALEVQSNEGTLAVVVSDAGFEWLCDRLHPQNLQIDDVHWFLLSQTEAQRMPSASDRVTLSLDDFQLSRRKPAPRKRAAKKTTAKRAPKKSSSRKKSAKRTAPKKADPQS